MSRRARIFLALVAAYAIGIAALLHQLHADVEPRYRESAEEALIETAQLIAAVIEQDAEAGALPADRIAAIFDALYARRFSAQVYELHKTRVNLRAYVTNGQGTVIYDAAGRALGQDFSHWRDVRNTLRGQYGARTTRDNPADPRSTVMYVAAPIRQGGDIVGVVTLGKPVRDFAPFVAATRRNMLAVGLAASISALVLALALSFWLMRPLGITSDILAALRAAWARGEDGRRSPRRAWRALRAQARAALQEMRDAIAGRNYVQEYVGQLTHELKSPLSALRGAAELLQEPALPPAQAARFAANIERETRRMQETVDRMMELTALESRRLLQRQQRVELAPLLHELAASARSRAPALRIEVQAPQPIAAEGDAYLLRRAIGNLLDNAVDFSSPRALPARPPAGGAHPHTGMPASMANMPAPAHPPSGAALPPGAAAPAMGQTAEVAAEMAAEMAAASAAASPAGNAADQATNQATDPAAGPGLPPGTTAAQPPQNPPAPAPAGPPAPDILITLTREGRWARISVRDQGPGLPAWAEGKVFDKFFSLARPGTQKRSTGLGLAFVKEIAALHQGSVSLQNANPAGHPTGALATLRLPALKSLPPAAAGTFKKDSEP